MNLSESNCLCELLLPILLHSYVHLPFFFSSRSNFVPDSLRTKHFEGRLDNRPSTAVYSATYYSVWQRYIALTRKHGSSLQDRKGW